MDAIFLQRGGLPTNGLSVYSALSTVILKLQLKIWPWGSVYETPVFDGATGGFVDVDGEAHLKFLHVGHFVVVRDGRIRAGTTDVGSTT